jgi:hypothetical protein
MKQLIATTASLLLIFGASANAGSAEVSNSAVKQNVTNQIQPAVKTTSQKIATNTNIKKLKKVGLMKKHEDKSEYKN